MNILRLGDSNDTFGPIPEDQRAWRIVERRLADDIGEPVRTILKSAWPSPSLPDAVERWLHQFEPDLVLVCTPSFWVAFPSAPLVLESSSSALMRRLGQAATSLSRRPAIAHTAAFRAARRLAYRTVGYRYFFEPAEVADCIEEVLRRVLRREEVALALRAPETLGLPLSPQIAAQSRARFLEMHRLLADACQRLHVPCLPDSPDATRDPAELLDDITHLNARGHRRFAQLEYRLHRLALEQSGRLPLQPRPLPPS
ncbi:SGNH/GDSL hydrolase family protein [Tepidiforma sp.]|uniref:SGNH/GDSL hydrolase family protein n=1 Tax=Tepidiforma sp. TaxID=2682230 RepID=UPI002ADD7A50|nr:SGNH/GDSL hydrolase family protein [Tepidiforma sp.]